MILISDKFVIYIYIYFINMITVKRKASDNFNRDQVRAKENE